MTTERASYPWHRGATALFLGALFGAVWGATMVPLTALGVYLVAGFIVFLPLGSWAIERLIHTAIGAVLIAGLYFFHGLVARKPQSATVAEAAHSKTDAAFGSAAFALFYVLMWLCCVLFVRDMAPL